MDQLIKLLSTRQILLLHSSVSLPVHVPSSETSLEPLTPQRPTTSHFDTKARDQFALSLAAIGRNVIDHIQLLSILLLSHNYAWQTLIGQKKRLICHHSRCYHLVVFFFSFFFFFFFVFYVYSRQLLVVDPRLENRGGTDMQRSLHHLVSWVSSVQSLSSRTWFGETGLYSPSAGADGGLPLAPAWTEGAGTTVLAQTTDLFPQSRGFSWGRLV